MSLEAIVSLYQEAFLVILLIAGPPLAAGLLVGVSVSVVQAVTQVNEMTLAFIPKILAVATAIVISLPWSMQRLVDFMGRIMELVAQGAG